MFISKLRIALLGLFLLISMASSAIIESGDAAVSGFSGTVIKGGEPFINTDGASLKVFDLNNRQPAQAQLLNAPVKLEVFAKDIGQVFGVALDNDTPPNIYATNTAAYGLHIVIPDANGDGFPDPVKVGQAGAAFMDGQFGTGGSAGSVWRIDGSTGQVTLFANLQNNGMDNGGAGLGNIVFDPTRYQLFISDLESGLIHQLDMNGNLLGTFDHGVQGRPNEGLSVVNDDGTQLDITNPAFDSDNSNTWGLTDIRRRVWGLAFYKGVLYYAVGDGPQIWSVGFNKDGSFANNAKIEIKTVPGGLPVTDILFTPRGQMILAQRGGLLGGSNFLQFHTPSNNTVLRYSRDANGQWIQQADEYAIGFPPNHRNTSGGVALSCDNVLWTTGDNLRNDPMLAGSGELVVHGLQGNKVSLVRPRNVPPWASWFVDYDSLYGDDTKSGHVGDVELYRDCNGTQDDWPGWEPLPPDWTFPPTWTPPPWWPPTPDLEIEKSDTQCDPAPLANQALLRECTFTITVTNVGGAAFTGFLTVVDNIPNNALFIPPPGGSIPWNCTQPAGLGTPVECISANPQTLLPGTSETVDITLSFPPAFQGDRLNNCATVIETGGNPDNNDDCGQGFEPGPDLELLKELDMCVEVPGGAQCSYWLDVTNVGNAPFNGPLHISETLPAGASFMGVSASSNAGWACWGGGGTVDCWLPAVALANGGNEWIEINIFVPEGGPTDQENCVTLGQPEHLNDPDINGNNSACAPVIAPLPRTINLLKGPGINFCPAGWTRQQINWQPQKGWESKTIGTGEDAITCGRKRPKKRLVCPHGWTEYPPSVSTPEGWEVQILGTGKEAITCAKPPLVVPVPIYTPPVKPLRPHCKTNEKRYYYHDDVPHNWSVRRVTRSGHTIWCAKPKPVIDLPHCYEGERRYSYRDDVPYNWSVRRVTRSGRTIWCAKPKPVVHLPRCYKGERRYIYRDQVPHNWSVRRVTRSGRTIWCAKPKPVVHLPRCYRGERRYIYRDQVPHNWSVRRVTRSGRTIWCAKPKPVRICPRGTHKYHGRCIPNVTHIDPGYDHHYPVTHCPRGTHRYHGRCVPNRKKIKRCRRGTYLSHGRCIPIRKKTTHGHYPSHNTHSTVRRCRRGTYLSHGRCVPIRRKTSHGHYPRHNTHRGHSQDR